MATKHRHITRARAQQVHRQTEINRRLFRAQRVAQIMSINMLHPKASPLLPSYAAALFSYLADDLRHLQQLCSTEPKH